MSVDARKPEVRYTWAVDMVGDLPLEASGGKGSITFRESGANFWNIVKGPVHGEKCVHNCVWKNGNCLFFSTSAPYFWASCEFYIIGFLRTLLNLLIFIGKQFFILINPLTIDFVIDLLQLIYWKYSEIGKIIVKTYHLGTGPYREKQEQGRRAVKHFVDLL
jgi:hypothetical protein